MTIKIPKLVSGFATQCVLLDHLCCCILCMQKDSTFALPLPFPAFCPLQLCRYALSDHPNPEKEREFLTYFQNLWFSEHDKLLIIIAYVIECMGIWALTAIPFWL